MFTNLDSKYWLHLDTTVNLPSQSVQNYIHDEDVRSESLENLGPAGAGIFLFCFGA